MSIYCGNLCCWALPKPFILLLLSACVFLPDLCFSWAEWLVISAITHLMHFLPQPCRSHSGYAPILCAGFAYPNEDALSVSEKADSYCKSVYRSFFFFPLNATWVNERFVLCISTFANALAIVFFTSDSLIVIHFINSTRHVLSSFILNCCIIYADKLSCQRSFAKYLVFSYPLAIYFWFLNNSFFFSCALCFFF